MPVCGSCDAVWGGIRPCHCGACHQTFSGLELFDAHRHHRGEHGGCLDPATVRGTGGYRRMFHRDGMWRGPEMDAETRAGMRALR